MALVIEDGTGKADAQTFASVDYLKAYAKARGITIPTVPADLESMLMLGMDAMRDLDYVGSKATKAQALPFPRTGVKIDDFEYASTELPSLLLDGQCALAIESKKTDLLPTIAANSSGGVIEKTVGEITLRYADSGRASTRPIVEKAKVHLRKLLRSGGNTLRVSRA